MRVAHPQRRRPQLARTADLPPIDPEALDATLGLDGDALLAIVAYEVAPEESPNYVWVTQYSEPAKAAEAAERYRARLSQPLDETDRTTVLKPQPRTGFSRVPGRPTRNLSSTSCPA